MTGHMPYDVERANAAELEALERQAAIRSAALVNAWRTVRQFDPSAGVFAEFNAAMTAIEDHLDWFEQVTASLLAERS